MVFLFGASRNGTRHTLDELENRVVALDDLWGVEARQVPDELSEIRNDAERIDRLEAVLVRRTEAGPRGEIAEHPRSDVVDCSEPRAVTVESPAGASGLSLQHFTRVFRNNVGVSSKMYCQPARLQSTLGCLQRGSEAGWAHVAAQRGYADQSHMIAGFRRFTGMTPETLLQGRWFHPFIEGSARRLGSRVSR